MATEIEYMERIRTYDAEGLKALWLQKKRRQVGTEFWKQGKLLEYIVLRAFELEGAEVTYPHTVELFDETVEQLDGTIRVGTLYSIVECKDNKTKPINISPLAKLRNILQRRHATVFGMFFSMSGYTTPADLMVRFMAPQMIILWTEQDVDYCIQHTKFLDCFHTKYREAIENCEYNYNYSMIQHAEIIQTDGE